MPLRERLSRIRTTLLADDSPLRIYGLALALSIPGLYLLLHGQYSLLTFLIFAVGFTIAWTLDHASSLLIVLLYLFLLGDVRRIVSMYAGSPKLDPLLVTGAVFSLYVTIPLFLRLRVVDGMSKAMLGITALMTLEVVNPRQGSLLVGMSGAMFFLVPMLWFWIARQYATERLLFLMAYRLVLPLGVAAALLGFYQTYIGFLPWEQIWIKHALENGYSALNIGGGHIRSFGFSVNSIEFGTLLMLATVCTLAAVFSGRRAYALLLPLLFSAQVLASMRGLLLKTVLAAVMMWAVRGRNPRAWIGRLALGSILGFGLLAYSVKHAAQDTPAAVPGKSSADFATSHVTQGLAHPLDAKYSTAGIHTQMFLGGITNGLKNPLGMGLGITTLGSGKFGSGEGTGSSEVDVSDVFTTTGVVGGVLYIFTMAIAFLRTLAYVRTGPRLLSLALLGVFIGMMGEWIPAGQYAVGPFLWFCIGFLANDRVQESVQLRTEELEAEGEPSWGKASLGEVLA